MAEGDLRLLVKARPGAAMRGLRLGAGPVTLQLEPLLPNIEARRPGLRAGAAPIWQTARAARADINPWDACHALMGGGLGIAGGVEFAEPDLEQQWVWATPNRQALGMAGGCGAAEPQDGDVYAIGPNDRWFRDLPFSQLAAAQQAVGAPAPRDRVRIAHLDTGYDPNHPTRPEFLRTDLQRNFADDDRPNDATDRPTAEINPMFGHGTGTIGILAGNVFDGAKLGGAPNLEVVPIRVANWVVLFRNSAIAKALDYVYGLWSNPATRVHVVTMSMGGVASGAWADAVNALYDRGVFVVTAAGNNFGNLPTRYIVYPARFRRVVAACGAMADGRPYADLPIRKMAGCYGPDSKQATAVAAYTPNIPWAKIGCPTVVDWDGGGTSAATPQVAAAAALWIQKNKAALDAYPQGWMRVEAVRKALFDSAKKIADPRAMERFGQGMLRANDMLAVRPARASELGKQDEDSALFGLFRGLAGLGARAELPVRERMLELEALQISQRSRDVESVLGGLAPDDPQFGAAGRMRALLEALADDASASAALKGAIAARLHASDQVRPPGAEPAAPPPPARAAGRTAPAAVAPSVLKPPLPKPKSRALKVYAFDPLMGTRPETVGLNEAVLHVRWEDPLEPGPRGEYVEVVDIDPPSGMAYAPIDLNDSSILAQQGLAPTEGNPQFHQQMVYAVAMKTIRHFEQALGRVALWAPRIARVDGRFDSRFVRRLRIYPHGLREANAFYSPERASLLFGYFNASRAEAGDNLPGGLVFTCLSHDIVAHETTHALLDGLHPRFKEPTSLDMLAFHEAFADVVALFQHFTMPEVLRSEIAKSRGNLDVADLLGGLAGQFGQAIGNRGALRNFIARLNEQTGEWERRKPTKQNYAEAEEAHDRGAVLVAAIFDAFRQIYSSKTEDLFRLASSGTGVLPPGRIPADLVDRLADEAAKIAGRVLNVCVRALDYCPPVDLTFGEYLRALITADRDLVPDDARGYRVAFISAFRERGIYPADVANLSVDALAWQRPDFDLAGLADVVGGFSRNWTLAADRYDVFLSSNDDARALHNFLTTGGTNSQTLAALGLVRSATDRTVTLDGVRGTVSALEVHSVRPARRVGPDDDILDDVIIEITQKWRPEDGGAQDGEAFRGGCTIIFDRQARKLRYVIRKRVGRRPRVEEQRAFQKSMAIGAAERGYFSAHDQRAEPFAMLHRDS